MWLACDEAVRVSVALYAEYARRGPSSLTGLGIIELGM